MSINNKRITKLRDYLFNVITSLTNNNNYQINANMLSDKKDDYSLDKIPTQSEVEYYVTGGGLYRDVYSFRSRKSYSQDVVVNLKNMGFFEDFEYAINSNNDRGILPDIDGIQSIECLSPFTMLSNDDGNTAIFDIQIQIVYEEDFERTIISL